MSIGVGDAVGGIAIGTGTALSKLGDILLAPINMMCNWAEEPLKRAEFNRQEEAKDRNVKREIERETEIVKIITEIEQLKKDKEFERMKAVSDAMMEYQKELTRINVEAVDAIGTMRIELQRKAYELIYEKTQQYQELQNRAVLQAQEQLDQIDNNHSLRESSKNILSNAVETKLVGIIRNTTQFIEQLNDDMHLISKDINLITSSGQKFIERHLEQFQLIGFNEQNQIELENDSSTKNTSQLPLNN